MKKKAETNEPAETAEIAAKMAETNLSNHSSTRSPGNKASTGKSPIQLTADAPEFTPTWAVPNAWAVKSSMVSAPSVAVKNVYVDGNCQEAQESEDQSSEDVSVDLWVCSIDVECVATGKGNHDRAVARVALVDAEENVLMDRLVKPSKPIVSYLTQLTGIKEGELDDALSLEEVREELLSLMPKHALIVGQGIQHDIDWLYLEEGTHYHSSHDIAHLFRVERPGDRFRYFSLRHEVMHLNGFEGAGKDIQEGIHDPSVDAIYSLRLYKTFVDAPEDDLIRARKKLSCVPATPPFWRTTPHIDGVEMGPAWFYTSK